MTAQEIFNQLKSHGARINVQNNVLEIDAPEAIPAALLDHARDFKSELLEMVKNQPIRPPAQTINAADLMRREYQEPNFAVQDIIPEGLTLFAGKPKLGKSWLVLSVALAVASGGRAFGKIPVKQGAVLYLALEDSHRRLQARLEQVLGDAVPPAALEFRTELPRLDDGGVLEIQDWLETHPNARLVILDTLARVKPRAAKNSQLYDADSDALKPLHRLALERGLAILIVHHTRKAGADDVFDTISSSTGLTGIVDAMMVLRRARNEASAILSVTGRDIEEKDLAMMFDPVTALWTINGDAKLYESVTPERRAVLDALTVPMTPAEIAKVLNRDAPSTRKLIFGMKGAGLVRRLSDGKYQPVTEGVTRYRGVTDPLVTPNKPSDTQDNPQRYRVTAHKQDTLIDGDCTRAVTPVTLEQNSVLDNVQSVTVATVTHGNVGNTSWNKVASSVKAESKRVGIALTPELEAMAKTVRSRLPQADRLALDGALKSAQSSDLDPAAVVRVLELIGQGQYDHKIR